MKNSLKAYVKSQDFSPSFGGLFLNPFYFARKGLRTEIQDLAPSLTGRLLDVGCGSKPYLGLFSVDSYEGLEVENPSSPDRSEADHHYDGQSFPFPDATYDSVFSSQVFEHVFEPERFLSEVYRTLKPGGHLLLSIPFVWDEHEQPRDFARYTSFGLKYLLEKHGFQVLEQRKTNASAAVLFQLVNAYLFKTLMTKSKWANRLVTIFILGPINFLGYVFSPLLPKNEDLYLDLLTLARKPV